MANSRSKYHTPLMSDADALRAKIRERHQRGSITADERSYLLRELDKGTPVRVVSQMIKSLVEI